MTTNITKQQLENAARAMGLDGEWSDTFTNPPKGEPMFIPFGGRGMWQPHLPTTQGKADLMDLMLALKIVYIDCGDYMWVVYEVEVERREGSGRILECNVQIINGDKYATLAEAVVSVASQIWESKNV
jgi:hypothetical protein